MRILGMNQFIIRLCMKCSAITLRRCSNRLNVLPITACTLPKRYQCSSIRDRSDLINVPLNDDFDFEEESPFSNIDFEAITNGDKDKVKALKVIQLEVDLMRQQGEKVPSCIHTNRWKDLLAASSPSQRISYLKHLWLIEIKQKHNKEKLQRKNELYLEFKAQQERMVKEIKTTSSPLEYNLTDTSLFHRIRNCSIHHYYNYRLLQAEWFGPKIILDCSYEPFMDVKNLSNCAKQMMLMWSENRENSNPYDVVFCNVDEQGPLWKKFDRLIPLMKEGDSPIHFTSNHYLDMFPKEKLVYLTPHCKEVLGNFNRDDIYIIGCFVDTNASQPVSLAKAKKEGLRMAKFPLDKYLKWSIGHKSLTLNQVLAILNDLKDGQSWPEALKHVPKRKITTRNLIDREENEKLNPLTAQGIRESYRKNLVYDLLLKDGISKK